MTGIIAHSMEGIMGDKGILPWYCSGDLKFFKEMTMGKKIVVGRKTFKSLPDLPGRDIFVMSRFDERLDAIVCNSMDDVPKDAVVCGGKMVYETFKDEIDEWYVTIIKMQCSGDTKINQHWFDDFELADVVQTTAEYVIGRYVRNEIM